MTPYTDTFGGARPVRRPFLSILIVVVTVGVSTILTVVTSIAAERTEREYSKALGSALTREAESRQAAAVNMATIQELRESLGQYKTAYDALLPRTTTAETAVQTLEAQVALLQIQRAGGCR